MVSKKVAGIIAGVVIAAIAIGVGIYFATLPKPAAPPAPPVTYIDVGVLVDLSGPLTTYGKDIRDALYIAVEDINAYFEERGLPYRVRIFVEDTRVDPTITFEKVTSLHARGIVLIVGPMGSGEVAKILPYTRENKIIAISPSSTAIPKLIGVTTPEEKKYLFRFVATDAYQTRAIARELTELGIKAVCITNIGNAWGRGLVEVGKPKFEDLGIKVKEVIEYPDPPPADFSPYITRLESCVRSLVEEGYSPNEIAVLAFSYEEVATMFAQTKPESILFNITWIGCDGTAKSSKVIDVCLERPEVAKVKLYSTLFIALGAEAYQKLNRTYYERYGRTPYQYALNAYDALWVLALSYVNVTERLGKYDPDEMARTIPKITEEYSRERGVTGLIILNEWNDRASGDYNIWYVTSECKWDRAGIWHWENDTITWYIGR